MTDIGFTHVALPVTNLDASIAFYGKYANMEAVHRRTDPKTGENVAWLTDHTRPFVIVLLQEPNVEHKLLPPAHLGVACESREVVDRLCDQAREEGCLNNGPADAGPPIGYWAFVTDPDGHILELTYGQEVALRVQETAKEKQPAESSV
ncbi:MULTISPECIES: VOC family protein [Trichocoleus]|uniref:VOC family protein n=1 Tax=Trichocoleus desertorum GB2-A4 TaxID=2933944 RepID=A0ABV0JDS0_9CYAN|nr:MULTISPECIES: VOC family protein [unclassified Trichocoleus]MBD1861329.1 VOC family protein [Trichocoleus sp. FACHB-46]MBD2096197.1 VOC family protein [Trichocoleus sp. FACHB-591]MBD2120853.1 VOC family protein [Trichocoleus sp. FACHB-262]